MALVKTDLQQLIEDKVTVAGFDVSNQHSFLSILTKAISEAVVEHIQSNAEVPVTSGSSAGTYSIT